MIDLKLLLQEERNMGKNPLSSYKTSNFINLDKDLSALKEEKAADLREATLLAMNDNKDSIVLEYIAGKIKLMLRPHESNILLNNLALDFYGARNWDVAEHIASAVVEKGESPKALRVLGDVAAEKGEDESKWNFYERYVKADNQDVDVIVKVADNYEILGNKKEAMSFYQRALLRLTKSEDDQKIKKIFDKLLENGKSEFPFYASYVLSMSERKPELAFELYKLLLNGLIEEREELKKVENKASEIKKNLDNIIFTARSMLLLKGDDLDIRKQLADALKVKYGKSSRFEEVSKKYNVLKADNPVVALDEFEKDIAYSEKTYVLRKADRKVGLIVSIDKDKLLVKYSAQDNQEVSLQSAYNALIPLTNQHIKAIKKGVPAQRIEAKIDGEGGIEWLVRTLLYSAVDNKLQLKDMKAEMVPSVMDEAKWKVVAEKIKEEVKCNPYIRIIPGASDTYELTAYPSTQEEKQLYMFRIPKNIYDKIGTMHNALSIKDIKKDSDAFLEMASFFKDVASDRNKPMDQRLSSILILDYASEHDVPVEAEIDFEDLYKTLSEMDKKEVFKAIENTDIKKEFIVKVAQTDKYAYDTLEMLFPLYISTFLATKLRQLDKKKYYDFINRTVNNFRDSISCFIYFAIDTKLSEKELKSAHLTADRIFKTELMALASCMKTLDSQENRKNTKALLKELVEMKAIDNFLESAERASIDEIKTLLLFNEGLDTPDKNRYREIIKKRFPDYEFSEQKEKMPNVYEVKALQGFMCTEASLDRKKAELKDLKEVQVPANLKDIATARELGDLRENSEYQYAKDHKRELERRVAELANDINTVRVMKKEDVVPGLIGFGMRVEIKDNIEDKIFNYTFLGRWESDPDNGVIDINAPVGKALINHKEGDNVQFQIGERICDYTILKLDEIDF